MNVIVSNLNRDKFSNLGVDIIKSIDGEFDVEEIVQSFSNFFFNRMFLDITAIKDYKNFSNIQKLSMGLDVDKIIILLNDDPIVNSNIYLSKLVSMGIYNFAKNVDELMYLYNNPNSYKDVAHYQQIDNSNGGETTNTGQDTTVAPGKLPYTGSGTAIIFAIVIVLVSAIIAYKKYNKLSDIK